MILKRKNEYHRQLSNKVNDPETRGKAYWPILKTLYNGKKISLIPTILVNNKLILNFKEEANHFNNFLASQCTPNCVSNVSLSSIQFVDQDIPNILHSLSYNKAHG